MSTTAQRRQGHRVSVGALRALVPVGLLVLTSCTHKVQVDPIKFEPIDITLHIYLEADEKLKSFFDDDIAGAAPDPGTPDPATPGPLPHGDTP